MQKYRISYQTATINPAIFLDTKDSLGTIEKGKIADKILLDSNPLRDIGKTQHINAVFVNGKYLKKHYNKCFKKLK